MNGELDQFLLGATVMASCIGALFFIRFWRKTRDRLFLVFAIAFWLLALNWLFLAFLRRPEYRTALYIFRLVAFTMIILGIIDKNRSRRREGARRISDAYIPADPARGDGDVR